MASLFIKSRSRIFHGHDWVMAYEVDHASGDPNPGDVVMLKDLKNRVLGCGIYNPNSLIIARRISRRKQKLNEDFFQRRIERAIAHRTSSPIDPRYCRLVWSESDGLPGLIVDRYGDHLVVQTTTLAMDQHLDIITKVLVEQIKPLSIIERNDAPIRRAEGLEERNGVLYGTDPGEVTIEINGITFTTHLLGGQKTGFYLDQIDSYAAVAKLAKGKRVLDCFTNQGGFALACAKAGATSVKAIDISEPDIERATKNAEANGLSEQIEWIAGNVFNFMLSMLVVIGYLVVVGVEFGSPLWVVGALLAQSTLCLGVALLVGSANVFFRDTEHLLNVVMLAWFFMTPVIYPISTVMSHEKLPSWVKTAYFANPMAGVVSAYRQGFLPEQSTVAIAPSLYALSFGMCLVGLLLGILAFRRGEPRFGDVL